MASTESFSSWHPAFMPHTAPSFDLASVNTDSDLRVAAPHQHTSKPTALFSTDAKHENSTTPYSVDEGTAERLEESSPVDPAKAEEHSILTLQEYNDSNSTDLELEKSDNDTQFAATDNHPVQEDLDDATAVAETDNSDDEESNSSSGGHGRPQSFARSAQAINWAEEDEADPEWTLQRSGTDPFKSLGPIDRSNTFPSVPPAHNPEGSHENELAHSQAEEIVAEVEQAQSTFFEREEAADDDFFSERAATAEEVSLSSTAGEALDYGQNFGGDNTETEYTDRFEEGVPLVETTGLSPSQSGQSLGAKSVLFADDVEAEEDDFFSGVAATKETDFVKPVLARKSTVQVMDSIHYKPDEEVLEDEIIMPETANSPGNNKNLTGGGIATSTSTILSQVLSDPNLEISPAEDSGGAQGNEEDLAAMWQAALADDEFLDDDDLLEDELLDDNTAMSGGLDPSTLFGSDDEGFLDDEDDTSGTKFENQLSPQVPAPVIGSDGQVVGFDRLASSVQSAPQSRYLPADAATGSPSSISLNSYTPAGPNFTNLVPQNQQNWGRPMTAPYGPSSTASTGFGAPQPPKPNLAKSSSFANQAKGGYQSPYDLPMDVVVPKKRASMQHMSQSYNNARSIPPAAPPRSVSMNPQGLVSGIPASSVSPPSTAYPSAQAQQAVSGTATTAPTLKSKASFFEELPMTSRPKPSGRYTPQPQTPAGPLAPAFNPTPPFQTAVPPPSQPVSQYPPSVQGLVAPPLVSPYANLNETPPQIPAQNSRYSPAPSQPNSSTPPPVGQGKYAAAPPVRPQSASYVPPPPPSAPFAHQPRTSSPLAHFERSSESRPYNGPPATALAQAQFRRGSSGLEHHHHSRALSMTPEVDEKDPNVQPPRGLERQGSYQQNYTSITPHSQSNLSSPPSKRATSSHMPHVPPQSSTFSPPQRSQTQSPSKLMGFSRADIAGSDPYQRPVSVHGPASPREVAHAFTPLSPIAAPKTHSRGFSQNFNYVIPTDGRERDPFQRWKGGPIFAWGVGGTVVTSFPKEIPRYGMSNTAPTISVSPGEVKVRSLKEIYPLESRIATFPGPLKGKSKKKDVVAWLTAGIDSLDQENSNFQNYQQSTHEDKRREERVLLWKTLRVMIENDGVLEGSENVTKAVRAILSPDLDREGTETAPQYTTGADLSGIHRPTGVIARAEAVDPAAVDELRKHLLRGDREKAVWEAVDKRLWAHAMLISNTVSKELYKQVAQEFVQKEVKSIGENTESLAALYEIFAGNFEESVDELVAPSARAGFQMVSASGSNGPAKGALDGLDRWRETLGLILSNRSPDDGQAILALGKLLSGYGRAEAAHTCFLFARAYAIFGGSDDPNAHIVLVGSDHLRQPAEFDTEVEPILLSEIYEFGLSLAAPSSVSTAAPHLAVYKLRHATVLAEAGQREKALQYCESVANAITSQTRRSPYHHALLVSALDDLSKRLKQSPRDESKSWISKPSIDKVSGSVWSKFNKFVAGDESDAQGSTDGVTGAEAGPFARIAGGTPTISPSPSSSDIYGSYPSAPSYNNAIPIPVVSKNASSSRYAPGGAYTPPSTYEPATSLPYGSQPHTSYPATGVVDQLAYGTSPQAGSAPQRYAPISHGQLGSQYAPSSYTPSQPTTPNMHPIATESLQGSPPSIHNSRPGPSFNGESVHEAFSQPQVPNYGYQPLENSSFTQAERASHDHEHVVQPTENETETSGGYEPHQTFGGYEPPESSGGYEPPQSNGYEPPAYVPYEPSADDLESPEDTKPKKKSFMDDDDDDIPALKKPAQKTKAEKDREADEAFKRAAEEDAKRASNTAPKKGWGLGGWFGGAKKEATPEVGQPNKPIRAKLGEESSFYYDPEQKRWINKKGGKDDSAAKGATPPPPRTGPPRTVSGTGPPSGPSSLRAPSGPPSGPPSRQASGSSLPPESTTPPILAEESGDSNSLAPPLMPPTMKRTVSNGSIGGPSSAPPSRPATGMSNASSIDDLLGPPQARKGGAAKGKKKGRGYIDVMGAK